MRHLVVFSCSLLVMLSAAMADPIADCNQDRDYQRLIRGCTLYLQHSRDPEGSANAHHNRAVAYMRKGLVDRAIADYTKVVELRPHYADAYYNRGLAHAAKGDSELAILDYAKAIENNPNDSEAYRRRADAYRAKGELARAIADYTRAIELNPTDAALYNGRGLAYVAKGDYAFAVADATKAAALALTSAPGAAPPARETAQAAQKRRAP